MSLDAPRGVKTIRPFAPLRMVRRDALPEDLIYRDDGCEVAPQCLACHLEGCRYDMPNGMAGIRTRERLEAIHNLKREGLTNVAVAARLGITRRTLYRTLQAAR